MLNDVRRSNPIRKTAAASMVFAFLIASVWFHSCKKDADKTEDLKYFPKVRSIIQANCLGCHSSSGAWTGRPIAFDNDSEIVAAHGSIKAAVADPETFVNKRMPQGGSLSAAEIEVIVNWNSKGGRLSD